MANMSYCRFQNTADDMRDCVDAIDNGELTELSNREQRAFVEFVELCRSVAERFNPYNNYEYEDMAIYIETLNHDKD